MPVTTSYPGIYIEELPSSAHTITAAATSITVFVGYTHPFKTRSFGEAVQIFSFTDYEREFGGLFASDVFDANLAYAVNQFFLNGGSNAYVVGLQPRYFDGSGNVVPDTDPNDPLYPTRRPRVDVGSLRFRAREPVDANHPMTVTISNPQGSPADTADVTIAYGKRTETFRRVTISSSSAPNFIDKQINGVSSLVTVEPTGASYATPIVGAAQANVAQSFTSTPPAFATTFSASDFADVFQQDSSLDKVSIFNLLTLPGVADNGIWSEALAFCERKQAFLILDPPRQAAADPSSSPLPLIATEMDNIVPKSPNGALYFPYLLSDDPLSGDTIELPPSGYVAGIYARTDNNRGVWKAPAGLETTITNTIGVVPRGRMTDMRQGTLNPKGINCLRAFPGIGTVVFGARTLVAENPAFEQWRYVPVRRMALFIEQTLLRNLTWVIFEPNDNPLWVAMRTSVEGFMLSLFHQGAFQGKTPSDAFRVICDSTTTTQQDIDNGRVNIVVAFAPLKPAEFVIVKIAQLAGQTQA